MIAADGMRADGSRSAQSDRIGGHGDSVRGQSVTSRIDWMLFGLLGFFCGCSCLFI